jgi:hypothetical protein
MDYIHLYMSYNQGFFNTPPQNHSAPCHLSARLKGAAAVKHSRPQAGGSAAMVALPIDVQVHVAAPAPSLPADL